MGERTADGVVDVAGMVDARGLDHDEEAALAVAGGGVQVVEGAQGHLLERRLLGGVAVGIVGKVVVGKQT